jgi:hypothetical protein
MQPSEPSPSTPEGTLPSQPVDRARKEVERASKRAEGMEERLRRNSTLRMVTFVLAATPFLLLETSPRTLWPALIAVGSAAAAVFLFLVRRHRRLRRVLELERVRLGLHLDSLARMGRRWSEAPLPELGSVPRDHPFAHDLDLFGRGSLGQLLGRVRTGPGRAALRRTLLDPFAPFPRRPSHLLGPPDPPGEEAASSALHPPPTGGEGTEWEMELRRRQDAVRALGAHPGLLDDLELAAAGVPGTSATQRTRAFTDWCESPPWLLARPGLLWAARATAVFNTATLTAWLMGWISPPLWLVGMVAAHLLHRTSAGEVHRRFAAAEGGEGDPLRWARLLEMARRLPSEDPLLASLRQRAESPGPGAPGALRRLRRINDVAAIRHSGLAHFPLVTLFVWDLHVLARLEGWQREFGAAAQDWILAVAELELLVALAGLHHENPDWAFPTFDPDARRGIRARELGHPLLPPARCVGNDVEVPGPGELLLVTGSNMAGKTTLLRALGANQVLALAGGPVAAVAMRTRALAPWTAMRVQDSVQEGVSLFMAELKRLHAVVEAARKGPILFLLDEILQGTNTAERRTAARIVLRHLLETEALGAVTTHDLTLADSPDLQERSVNIHFREDVVERDGRRRLHFDYRLRPGPATSRNALLLLELVGLGPDPSWSPLAASSPSDGASSDARSHGEEGSRVGDADPRGGSPAP